MDFMAEALRLAHQVQGRTRPNPAVGAVVVREGRIVGRGATQPAGGWHAERVALAEAGEAARGAVLYVTLEPCAHHGRTPPCTEAIIAAGIVEVHIAVLDPNPLVNGRGIAALQAAGIRVILGEHAEEARRLNEAFFKAIVTGYPFVIAKYAMSLDGRIATFTGDSRWISGPEARAWAHRLRAQADAVLVGVGTVLRDDPELTARPEEFGAPPAEHQPIRVVVDSRARTPLHARVLNQRAPTWIATTERADPSRLAALRARGARVIVLPPSDQGVDLDALLRYLGAQEIRSVLVEGGGRLLGSLFDRGQIDKVAVFIAPLLIGGERAPGPIAGHGRPCVAQAVPLQDVEIRTLGPDLLILGYPRWPEEEQDLPCSPALWRKSGPSSAAPHRN